jgi:VWFA-related protein
VVSPTVFSLVDLPIEPPFAPVNASGPIEPDVRATTRTFDGRIYVLLLDDLHTNVTRTQHVRDVANQDALAGESQPIRTAEGRQRAEAIRDPDDQQRAFNVRRAFDAIESVSGWLADVPGRRKALLFFSEGFDYDIYQPFQISREGSGVLQEAQEAFAAAQRANVNVYGIDPRGLSQFGEMIQVSGRSDYPQLDYGTFRGQLRELLLSQESLIALAEETGGLAIVDAGDVAGGLGRVVLDNSRYYLLGYYSDSSKWSRNRFLKLELPPGRYQLHVGAHESTGGAVATVPFDVEVPDYSKLPFAITGLALTSSEANALVTPNPDPALKDAPPAPPVARRLFSPSETLTYYAEVYEGPSKTAHAVEFVTSVQHARDARSAFESGGRTVVQASPRPQTFGFTTDFSLKGLAPGPCVLRVETRSTVDGRTARKEILFEVRP